MKQGMRAFLTLLCVILFCRNRRLPKGRQNRLRGKSASNRYGHHGNGIYDEAVLDG